MIYGKLIVIPNEDILSRKVFEKDIPDGLSHIYGLNEFCKEYKLNHIFTNDDSFTGPEVLSREGHLVLRTVETQGTCFFYIPERVSNNQNEWFYENKEQLKKYLEQYAYSFTKDKTKEITGLNNIQKEINLKNMLYEERSEKNVRKKI